MKLVMAINAALVALTLGALTSSWWAPLVFSPPAALPLCRTGMTLEPGAGCRIILRLRLPLPRGPETSDEWRDHA